MHGYMCKGSYRWTELQNARIRRGSTDLVASVTPSVCDLRYFERVTLSPGETRRVEIALPVSSLAIVGGDMKRRVEPGEFILRAGGDSRSGIERRLVVKR